MRGPSHVAFGLAGALVLDSAFHLSGLPLFGSGVALTPDLLAQKVIYYGFAAFGALVPDIDNARSTLGRRMGVVSREIQKHAGHRTIFHSLLGLTLVGALIWAVQYALGLALYHAGLLRTGAALAAGLAPGGFVAGGLGIAFTALLVGYFLHLVADSLTEGGVPWLYPSHVRYGFPPNRNWRFRSGSAVEPVVVVAVGVLVIVGVYAHYLTV